MTLHRILRDLFRRVQGYSVDEQFEILQRAANGERPRLSSIMARTLTDADGAIVAEGSSARLSIVGKIVMGDGVRIPLSSIPVLGTEAHLLDALLSRVEGKTPGAEASDIFSTLDQIVGIYVRSSESIVSDIENSAMVARHSNRGLSDYDLGGTLLTPNIVEVPWQSVAANHIRLSDKIRLVNMEGEWADRRIVALLRVGTTDVTLALMDREYPPSYLPAKVLPPDYADHFDITGQPVLYTNKDRKAYIGQVGAYNAGNSTTDLVVSDNGDLSGYFVQPVSGDAGATVALVMDDSLVWLGHVASTTAFSFWPTQYDDLAAAVAELDPKQSLRVQTFPKGGQGFDKSFVRSRNATPVAYTHGATYATVTNLPLINGTGESFTAGVFTAKRDGLYRMEASIVHTDPNGEEAIEIGMSRNNGSAPSDDFASMDYDVANVSGSATMRLSKGDTLRLKIAADELGSASIIVHHFAIIEN